ncbi:MAG: CDP-alcohol phosphatidyltransferase family protein [Candidatus Melainabacteria bacterium]|nr:CDP-alcohol phosphatidyltransferase family protein [Candidatus Melainabacteria bacterium]
MFLCLITCAFIATGIPVFLIIGAVLIQLVFILDCLDGQLARYRNESSNFGAWYDRVTDRVKDFLIYFSIAWGHYRVYEDWKIWPLAMASLFFVYLFDYYVNQDIKLESRLQTRDQRPETRKRSIVYSLWSMVLNKIFSLGERIYKSIPILQFHIGEQYLLISLFLFFNQTRLLCYLIILLGMFYSIYWPLAKYYGRKPN